MRARSRILIISTFLLVTSMAVIAQNSPQGTLNVEISVTNGQSDNSLITLAVDCENPPYTVQVYDALPWEGGNELLKSQPQHSTEYIISELKDGNYYICVTDRQNNTDCELIEISSR